MGLWKNGHNLWILQRENVDQRTINKVEQQQPTVFSMLQEWQSSVPSLTIGRMYYAHPTSDECYYLRMLLNYVKGTTSYEHLRIMDGTEHDTFKDVCIAMVLLAYDNEWHQALEKASLWASGR
jgi:hypothetical protein